MGPWGRTTPLGSLVGPTHVLGGRTTPPASLAGLAHVSCGGWSPPAPTGKLPSLGVVYVRVSVSHVWKFSGSAPHATNWKGSPCPICVHWHSDKCCYEMCYFDLLCCPGYWELSDPFVLSRGLRQGDPISPYLFLFYTEGLSNLVKKKEVQGQLKGIRSGSGTRWYLICCLGVTLFSSHGVTNGVLILWSRLLMSITVGLVSVWTYRRDLYFFWHALRGKSLK